MALDNMPVNGFVQKVKAGDKATVEPVKADFNFLHGKFDSVAGHRHTGAAGDAPVLDNYKRKVFRWASQEINHRGNMTWSISINGVNIYNHIAVPYGDIGSVCSYPIEEKFEYSLHCWVSAIEGCNNPPCIMKDTNIINIAGIGYVYTLNFIASGARTSPPDSGETLYTARLCMVYSLL